MNQYKYFKLSEFACPCCGANNISPKLVAKLDVARGISGIPYKVNSGCRCDKHNRAVGGVDDGSHEDGYAADISAKDSVTRYKVLTGLIAAGFNRIGVYKTFIHADIDPNLPQFVIWYG